MKKRYTLQDVADKAGVSTATVARVIHDKGYVAADTRKRVEDAIEQTGYRINVMARGLRKQRSYILGHIVTSTFPNPFYVQVSLGAEQAAFEQGYSIHTLNMQGDPERERLGIETFIRRRVDAIIFTRLSSLDNLQLVLDAGIPFVQVERPLIGGTNCVLVDNYTGAVEAMEHLLQFGHQRIAFIGQDPKAEQISRCQTCWPKSVFAAIVTTDSVYAFDPLVPAKRKHIRQMCDRFFLWLLLVLLRQFRRCIQFASKKRDIPGKTIAN